MRICADPGGIRRRIMADARTPARAEASRPLSPHLSIYRPMLTMMMSIVHRITGAALYFGTLLLAWWLLAVASGPNAYAVFQSAASSFIGRLVLFGYTWALIHHMLGGLRHFVWDTGSSLDIASVDVLSWATIILSLLLTAALWFYIAVERGWVAAWQ